MRSLTDQQVTEIREKYKLPGITLEILADEYHCSVFTISVWADPDPARRVKAFKKRITIKLCHCGISYTVHKRCPICTQLLHGECDCTNNKPYFSQDINNFL